MKIIIHKVDYGFIITNTATEEIRVCERDYNLLEHIQALFADKPEKESMPISNFPTPPPMPIAVDASDPDKENF